MSKIIELDPKRRQKLMMALPNGLKIPAMHYSEEGRELMEFYGSIKQWNAELHPYPAEPDEISKAQTITRAMKMILEMPNLPNDYKNPLLSLASMLTADGVLFEDQLIELVETRSRALGTTRGERRYPDDLNDS